MTSPTNPDPSPEKDDRTPADGAKTPPKVRKRRKWPWVIVGIVVVLLVLVLLAPTIVSSGPVTSFIAGQAKNYINGSVKIGDLSVGWFNPTRVGGVKIYDDKGVLILELNHFQTQLSLLDAIRGHYNLGDTVIDANLTKCTVNADHSINYQHLLKTSSKTTGAKGGAKKAKSESKLPEVTGNITVNYRGTIDGPGVAEVVHIEPSTAVVKITDINQPISDDIKLVYRAGESTPATISVAGVVDAIQNNQVVDFAKDLTKLSADQKLQLTNVDLATAKPFLNKQDSEAMQLGGIANGTLTLKADGKSRFAADGAIAVSDFVAGGGPLRGDVYKSAKVSLPVNVSATAAGPDNTVLDIQQLGLQTDQASISLTGKASQQALVNLAAKKAPGADGNLSLAIDVTNLPALASDLRNTLHLQKGVVITEGKIFSKTNLAIARDHITITQDPNTVIEAAGTNNGQKITLEPIELKRFQVTALPTGAAIPELRDIDLDLSTVFGSITGGGTTLSDLSIKGENLNLAKVQEQVAQFSDLGKLELAGTGAFALTSKGDLTKPGGMANAHFNLDLHDLIVRGLASGHDLNEPLISATASGTLVRGQSEGEFLAEIKDIAIGAQAGNSQSPVVNLSAQVQRVALNPMNASDAVATLGIPNLPQAQQEFGGFIPALKDLQIQQGQLSTTLAGNYDGSTLSFTKPLTVSLAHITLASTQSGKPRTILHDETIDASLSAQTSLASNARTLTIEGGEISSSFARTTLGKTVVNLDGGNIFDKLAKASLEIVVPNVPRLYDLMRATTGSAEEKPLQITSGGAQFKLDITRDPASQTTTITAPTCRVTKLAVARSAQTYKLPDDRAIDLKLAAEVRTAGDGIGEIKLTQFGGDAGIAKLDMPNPITITGLGEALSANGEIKLTGAIQDATPLLAVVLGQPAKTYAGNYAVTQNVVTKEKKITLKGTIAIPTLQTDPKIKPQSFSINDDVDADTSAHNVTIHDLSVSMPDTKAIGVTLKGKLLDWADQRKFENMTMNLSYALGPLWELVKPGIDPDTAKQVDELSGNYSRVFKIEGSYPAKTKDGRVLTSQESLKSVSIDGAIGVGKFKGSGLDVSIKELPIYLRDGHIYTLYMDRPKAERVPQPAAVNGGTADLGSFDIDLTGDEPMLSIGKNQRLMHQVQLNPVLADQMGKFFAFIFKDAQQANGLIDLTVAECKKVPLGQLLKSPKSKGTAKVELAISNLQLNSQISQWIGQAAQLGNQGIVGNVKDSTITYAGGKTNANISIYLDRKGVQVPLRMTGGIDLSSGALINMVTTIPSELFGSKDLLNAAPEGIPISWRGTTSKYSPDLAATVRKVAELEAQGALGNLLGGNKNKSEKSKGADNKPSNDNPLGDLLNQLDNSKSKKKK